MKKIINGKKYDTETATEIGYGGSAGGISTTDFRYYDETLYRKKNGEFFLAGEGHAMTKYATHNGNTSGWGEAIIPLTDEEAKAWVEQECDAETYEEIFGDVEE